MGKRSAIVKKRSVRAPGAKRTSVVTATHGTIANEGFKGLSSLADLQVLVGPELEEQMYLLHRAVLSLNSGYFEKMFQRNRFREGQQNKVVLRDADPHAFRFVAYYLYHGELLLAPAGSNYWDLETYANVIREAVYFDIAPMIRDAIRMFSQALGNDNEKKRYLPDGDLEYQFTTALRIIFELYATQSTSLGPILHALVHSDYLRYILADEDLQEVLDAEPALLRFLQIQITFKDNDDYMTTMRAREDTEE